MTEMPPPAILIVEDEFLIRMMLAETLTDEGFAVAEAGTGDEAIALLRAGTTRFALMLTDLSLPGGMDGLELARQARIVQADLPIIFVTGRPDAIGPEMLNPRDAVVAKPYLPSAIAAAAQRLLQR